MLELTGVISGHVPGAPVLRGLDLSLAEGQVLAVLGRNGVGKSTLLQTVMGILPPSGGSIRLDGRPIEGLRPEAIARAGIGFVPQGRGIFAHLTVTQNLMLGALGVDLRRGRVPPELLDRFPILRERAAQPAGTLSGGEQQLLAIARALAGRPRLLLLDEPSEGIQPSIVAAIGRTLTALVAEAGLTILLAEQNLDLVHAAADRCLFMGEGRILAEHRPEDLRRDRAILDRHLGV